MPSPTGAISSGKRGHFTLIWDKWFNDNGKARSQDFELIALDVRGGRVGSVRLQEETETLRLVLQPAVHITGVVVYPNGAPVERALVSSWLRGQPDAWGLNLSTSKRILTDRSGRFTIFPVPAGRTCEIAIRAKGYDKVKKELQTPADTTQPFHMGTIKLTPKSANDS
jgi:hypothetical protein